MVDVVDTSLSISSLLPLHLIGNTRTFCVLPNFFHFPTNNNDG